MKTWSQIKEEGRAARMKCPACLDSGVAPSEHSNTCFEYCVCDKGLRLRRHSHSQLATVIIVGALIGALLMYFALLP